VKKEYDAKQLAKEAVFLADCVLFSLSGIVGLAGAILGVASDYMTNAAKFINFGLLKEEEDDIVYIQVNARKKIESGVLDHIPADWRIKSLKRGGAAPASSEVPAEPDTPPANVDTPDVEVSEHSDLRDVLR